MVYKINFELNDGTLDEIIISGDTIEEIREIAKHQMIVVTYKKLNQDGVIHLPFRDGMVNAKNYADRLYKEGYFNVKVVEIKEKVLYEPR